MVTPSFTSDTYREGLTWRNSLVEKGLFSKDSFTLDDSVVKGLTSRPNEMIVGSSGGWFESSFGDMSVLPTLWTDYEAVPPLANEEGVRRTINNNGDIAMNSFITGSSRVRKSFSSTSRRNARTGCACWCRSATARC